MAKCEITLPTELMTKFSALGKNTDNIIEKVLKAGAEVAANVMKTTLAEVIGRDTKYKSRSTGKLLELLGYSPVKLDREGRSNVKIGFAPYEQSYNDRWKNRAKKKGTYLKNGVKRIVGGVGHMVGNLSVTLPLILEYGKSGQPPKPFLATTKKRANALVKAAMEKVFNEEVDKL